jgi:hypothetical protein
MVVNIGFVIIVGVIAGEIAGEIAWFAARVAITTRMFYLKKVRNVQNSQLLTLG